MNTVREIKEYLESFDDDEFIIFAVIHKDDRKYLKRSIDNQVSVFLKYPMIPLQAISSGKAGNPGNLTNTIFLTNDKR